MVRWDNQSNSDLLTCLYDVYSKEMGREVQAQIVDKMKSKGHEDVNWDKIRYVSICCFQLRHWSGPVIGLLPLSDHVCLALPSGAASGRPFPAGSPFTMPPPTKYINRWEDIKDDVFEIIYNMKAPLSAEDKDQLVKAMRERGYNIGWNGLRYVIRLNRC
ncbi:hypothetical protein QC763_0090830 [Podospora pseudopauciseta]|uniref:Clr5 domain-containing protein n=1 Tax=Podospora pseudopauciseta TaxID=2093780 RepID=A0ABR0H3T2_9PEZI|nr:hypothetical protein QC763_0090830 [Podospora pseudopauciseta]